MTDYGQDLRFGVFVTPAAADPLRAVELAELADAVGLDLVSVQDHPYQARHLDAWTLLAVMAARTSQIRLAPNVANLPLRPPAVLARSVASLDLLSNGRIELGLGTGAFWDAIVALGGPRRSPGESVDALVEALTVIRALWDTSARSVRHDGPHYPVHGAHPGPAPAHPVEIWLGAYGPRMLRVTGAQADGWIPSMGYADPDRLPELTRILDDAATAAGRDPAAVRRLYNINGSFGSGAGFLQGRPRDWAEQLAGLTRDFGMSTYVLASDDAEALRIFADEVAPAVRELVAAERAAVATPAGTDVVPETPVRAEPARTALTFGVAATPDDGVRVSAEQVWDESTRPTGPAPDPGLAYSDQQLATGQHLVDVHDALRAELAQLRDVIDQVARGQVRADAARSLINTLALRQNNWTLGAFCESYCRIVTAHHSLEDHSVFPHLRRADPRLAPVLDRLEEEHEVIADVLDRVDRALVALVSDDSALSGVQAAVDLLTDTLVSHLSYEERELVEPLARVGFY